MSILILLLIASIVIAFKLNTHLSNPIFKRKTQNLHSKSSQINILDFMFKPKSDGKPHKPKIRWRR
jgi:hypothetical protein